jgi:hypothetical protein
MGSTLQEKCRSRSMTSGDKGDLNFQIYLEKLAIAADSVG